MWPCYIKTGIHTQQFTDQIQKICTELKQNQIFFKYNNLQSDNNEKWHSLMYTLWFQNFI